MIYLRQSMLDSKSDGRQGQRNASHGREKLINKLAATAPAEITAREFDDVPLDT